MSNQQLFDIYREKKEKEDKEMDELVAESQAEYDNTAEFLGFQEPKREDDDKHKE